MQSKYDLIVLGGGKGGVLASVYAGFMGAKVLLIEKHDFQLNNFSLEKVSFDDLFKISKTLNASRESKKYGFKVDESDLSLQKIFDDIHLNADKIRKNNLELLKQNKVQVEFGDFHFTDEDSGVLEREEGKLEINFRKCIIASGTTPFIPNIKGLNLIPYYTYENIFSLKQVPKELIVLGAGATGVLLAQFFARMGSKVKVIQRIERVLAREDKQASLLLAQNFKNEGIEFYFNSTPLEFNVSNGLIKVKLTGSGKKDFELTGSHLLVCTGRKPNVQDFNLDNAEVVYDLKGIKHKDFLQTTNRRIYVIGEAVDTSLYANVVDEHAFIAVNNALFSIPILKRMKRISSLIIPHCITCDPELARVGYTEDECKELELNYRVYSTDFINGFLKVIVDSKNLIIGCTCVGKNASGIVDYISLAMKNSIQVSELIEFVRSTNDSPITRIAEQARKNSFTLSSKNFIKWFFKLKG